MDWIDATLPTLDDKPHQSTRSSLAEQDVMVLSSKEFDLKRLGSRYIKENIRASKEGSSDSMVRLTRDGLMKEVQEGLSSFRQDFDSKPSADGNISDLTPLPSDFEGKIDEASSELTPLSDEEEEASDVDDGVRRVRPRLDLSTDGEEDQGNFDVNQIRHAWLQGDAADGGDDADDEGDVDPNAKFNYLGKRRRLLLPEVAIAGWRETSIDFSQRGTPSSNDPTQPEPSSHEGEPLVEVVGQKRLRTRGRGHEEKQMEERKNLRVNQGRSRAVRLGERFQNAMQILQNDNFDLSRDALVATSGWKGREPTGMSKKRIRNLWKSGKINEYLSTFRRVPCTIPQQPLVLADRKRRAFIFRSTAADFLLNEGVGQEFVRENIEFAASICSQQKPKTAKDDVRGPHEPIIVGYHREYSESPVITAFERAHTDATIKLANSASMKRVCGHIRRLLRLAFPAVAKRYERCIEWHRKKYGIRPKFGLFWNYCFNALYEGQDRVHCRPHSDSKNVVGICAVMVYELEGANFDYSRKSWLCIWDAGVILELRPWQVILYPSSLMYHFNVDIDGIDVLTTDGTYPTKENTTPIQKDGACGRGSVVFFNQASMFQSSETNSATLDIAKGKGYSVTRDFAGDVDELYPSVVTV